MAHIDAGKTTTTERILFYTGATTRSVRCTRAPRRWTGWSRSRSAGITITSAATTCRWRDCCDQHHRHPRPRRLHRRGRAVAARARRRGRGLRRGRRRRAPDRDGLAPGRQVQRAALLLRQQDGPHRRELRALRRDDPRPPRRDRRRSSSCRSASSRTSAASSTSSTMKALIWDDEGMGEKWRRRGDPRRRSPKAAEQARHDLIDVRLQLRRHRDGEVRRRRGDHRRRTCAGASATGTIAGHLVPVLCGSAFKNKGVQPLLDAVVDYLPSPLDIPPTHGHRRRTARRARARAERRRAVRRARLQDHDRPLRRQAHLPPRLLGHAREGLDGAQLDQGQARAHRPHPADARQPPRGQGRRRARATSSPSSASSRRRPATRCATRTNPIVLEALDVPRAGDPRRRRAEDQGRPGQARQGAVRPLRGGPDLPGPHRRGDRPDGHLRHGRAAPRGARRPDAARVQGRRQRRQAPGRLPRDDPATRWTRSRSATSARPAAAASTATSSSTSSRPAPAVATSSSTRSPAA